MYLYYFIILKVRKPFLLNISFHKRMSMTFDQFFIAQLPRPCKTDLSISKKYETPLILLTPPQILK